MDRRTFLLGFLGSLAVAPTIIATASSVEAASVPEALPPTSQPEPEPADDLGTVESDWSQYAYRRGRRVYRRAYRRGARRVYRRAYYRGPYRRRARRVYRRAYRRRYY
jgi:hypothetical protein